MKEFGNSVLEFTVAIMTAAVILATCLLAVWLGLHVHWVFYLGFILVPVWLAAGISLLNRISL